MATRQDLLGRNQTASERTGRASQPQEISKLDSILAQLTPKEPDPPSKLAKALSITGDALSAAASAVSRGRHPPSNFTKRLMENFREDTQRAADRTERVGMLRLKEIMGVDAREDMQEFQAQLAGDTRKSTEKVAKAGDDAQRDIAADRNTTTAEIAEARDSNNMAIARLNAGVAKLRATSDPATAARLAGAYAALGTDFLRGTRTVGTDIKQFARDNDVDEQTALAMMREEARTIASLQQFPEEMLTDLMGLWDLNVGRAAGRYFAKEAQKPAERKKRIARDEGLAKSIQEDLLGGLQVPAITNRR